LFILDILGLPDEEDDSDPSTLKFKNGCSAIVLFYPIFFNPRGGANEAPPFPTFPDQGIRWIRISVEDDYP
jgi:hypothetical protein